MGVYNKHGVEPLPEQVATYITRYCKSEITGIEYYPASHCFDVFFKIESLVGQAYKNSFRIHVQRPYMNTELYGIFTELVRMIHGEFTDEDEACIDISFAQKSKISKKVKECIVSNRLGTLSDIFNQYPGLTFAINGNYSIKQQASTVISLGNRKMTGDNFNNLPDKMVKWLKEYPIFELIIDTDSPMKSSRVAFVTPDGFKDFFQFKYLPSLIQISESIVFEQESNEPIRTFEL